VHLPIGGGRWCEQGIEAAIDPGEPQMQQMIEAILVPAHTNAFEALLDEPFARTLVRINLLNFQ
jgi:hypothetical protein